MTWLNPLTEVSKCGGQGGGAARSGEEKREERQSALRLPLTHAVVRQLRGAEWKEFQRREKQRQREARRNGVWLIYTNTHILTSHLPYASTRTLAGMPAARLDGTARTPTPHTHTHAHTPTETQTLERTMVVQGAVTPGRTRRLMLKLPVGTLRRNSGDRVSHGRLSSLPSHCHPSFV